MPISYYLPPGHPLEARGKHQRTSGPIPRGVVAVAACIGQATIGYCTVGVSSIWKWGLCAGNILTILAITRATLCRYIVSRREILVLQYYDIKEMRSFDVQSGYHW